VSGPEEPDHRPLAEPLPARRGHFRFESGHHWELWLDRELLLVEPEPVRRQARRLAGRVAAGRPEIVCGPLVEGAFVALLAAEEGIGLETRAVVRSARSALRARRSPLESWSDGRARAVAQPRPSRDVTRVALRIAAVLLLGAAPAAAQEAGPPAPPDPAELRRFEASGFTGVDDAPIRRALERSLELYTVASAADFGSTHFALNRGGREVNPLIRQHGLVAPVKVISVYAVLRIEEKLRRSRHDGWAGFLRWSFVVLNIGLATWNLATLPGRGSR
jgi:orotate phosphoribosyltransferase